MKYCIHCKKKQHTLVCNPTGKKNDEYEVCIKCWNKITPNLSSIFNKDIGKTINDIFGGLV